ncbi:MAG: GNAT family N-acetyltransferase [Acidimicrobiales bacterium]|nr:GNAT family N-acetyltransferase [Acidimicrobiales bacterium]
MRTSDVVQLGTNRFRVGPWRGDSTIAFVAPLPGQLPDGAAIEGCLTLLARSGYRSVLTSALSEGEQRPFLDVGFTVLERLHLLRHDLVNLPESPKSFQLRRARRRDRIDVLALDRRAFAPFWRFDEQGLFEARAATPTSRFRVAVEAGQIAGYAITGRAGFVAYLQRLAVDPHHQHRGIGTALVADALRWARRRGARSMLVNTQEDNEVAFALYKRCGFVPEDHGLAVLDRPLGENAPHLHRAEQ